MKTFNHLSLEEREKITVLQSKGYSIRNIALELGRSPSTISRELNRNNALFFKGVYIGSQTHLRVVKSWKDKHKRINSFLNQSNVSYFIENNLKYGYSPSIISYLLKIRFNKTVSHETLYLYIYSSKRKLFKYLLRRKIGRISRRIKLMNRFTYMGTGKNIPNRIDIDLRNNLANQRLEFGHFEADSIESKKQRIKDDNGKVKFKTNGCLTILVDRTTRLTKIMKTTSKTAQATTTSIVTVLKPFANNIHSITYDNGNEFSQHEKINKELNCKSYFCKPYHSWEKGTVENINGLIRRFFPKGTNFDNISEEDIQYVEDWINNRPMKILNYLTPNEKCKELGVAIAS